MLCAHTVHRLKPGTFDQFREAFRPPSDDPPPGWVRFHMLRGLADDEVVTFGFFDGSLEGLREYLNSAPFAEQPGASGSEEAPKAMEAALL